MGVDKASLPWGDSTLLGQVCAVLCGAVDGPVLVVRAQGQPLPALPAGVEVHDDPTPGLGPVQGLATGLGAIGTRVPVAFVAATDLPHLHPAVVRHTTTALRDDPEADVAAAVIGGHLQLLAAAYRPGPAAVVLGAALARGDRRLRTAVGGLRVRRLAETDLLADLDVAAGDPGLTSYLNVNDPQDYARATATRSGRA